MPKIILVTLIHNRKHLLSEAIQSALNQTLSKDQYRHLLIDNASTDGADKIAETFARKFDHIELIKNDKNVHQMPAYNQALKWIEEHHPKAKFMVQLDSDDRLKPQALKKVSDAFQSDSRVVQVYSGFDIINKKGKTVHKNHAKARYIPNQLSEEGQARLRKFFIAQNPIGHIRSFRISNLKAIGGFDESRRFATDYSMAGKSLESGWVIKVNESLYEWRQHDCQVERQHSPEQTKNWQELQKYYKERWTKMGLYDR